jgi:hypothetical protein
MAVLSPPMPVVSFPWDTQRVSIRRETVPGARWDKLKGAWPMTAAEVEAFLHAAQDRMYFRLKGTMTVDGLIWVLGFAQGTPYRLDTSGRRVG